MNVPLGEEGFSSVPLAPAGATGALKVVVSESPSTHVAGQRLLLLPLQLPLPGVLAQQKEQQLSSPFDRSQGSLAGRLVGHLGSLHSKNQ